VVKTNLGMLLKVGVVGLAVYLALRSGLFSALNNRLGRGLLLGGLVVQPIIVCCFVVLAMRHVLLVGAPRIRLGVAFRAIVLSQGLNLVLPARLSELLKATYLRDHASVPLSSGVSAVVLERTVDVLIVAALGALGVVQYFDRGNFASVPALGLGFALVILVLVRSPDFVLRLVHAVPSERLAGFLERTFLHFSATAGTRAFWQALLLGGLAWGLSYINILVFLELAGSLPIGLSGALLVFVLTTLGGAIPALPGGLGTYEAAAVIALRALGYSFDEALVLSLAMHAAQLILPFVLAVLIMLTERLGISSLVADLRRSAAIEDASGDGHVKGKGIDD
jgi:uncharacterized membrane protein YbhN (UPF0104 family)